MRRASQIPPMPTVAVTRRSPAGRSLVSVRRWRVSSRRRRMSWAALNSTSPCSVRMRPRAWRWKSGTFRSCSRALIWRLTEDWFTPSFSPARVKFPASTTSKNNLILSQSNAGPQDGSGCKSLVILTRFRGLFSLLDHQFEGHADRIVPMDEFAREDRPFHVDHIDGQPGSWATAHAPHGALPDQNLGGVGIHPG